MTEGPVVDVRVILPDDWWVIPLVDPVARDRSINILIDRQFAGITDQPLLRAEMVAALRAQTTQAPRTTAAFSR